MNFVRNLSCSIAVALASLTAGAAGAPHWIDILPLSEPLPDYLVEDAVFMGNETTVDGIAWTCEFIPEGDPAMDKASVYAARIRRINPLIRARSKVKLGVLVQATIGHGWTPGRETPWQRTVQSDGRMTYRFCPLGQPFRRYLAGQLKTLAATDPDFFMVDDDMKLMDAKVDGCYCPLHLAGFAEKSGRNWTREALVGAIVKGDRRLAAAWRAYVEATVVDFAGLIRSAFPADVPGVFCTVPGPKERLGFVLPCARALAGPGHRPTIRLGSAPYWSTGLFDVLDVRRLVAYQLAHLHPEADVLVEADTCPQVRWQTSATRALDHTTMFLAEGCCGAKMWWHRLGNPHEKRSSTAYLRAFGERTGAFEWLCGAGFTASGVWCPAAEELVEWGANVFGRIGLPYHYGARQAGDVTALTADSEALLDDAALKEVLAGPVILDGSAALALAKRGFGDLIGVRAKPWTGKSVTCEDYGDAEERSPCGEGPVDLSDRASGTEELTRFMNKVSVLMDEATYLGPGSLWYENGLGGRVVTVSATIPKAPWYLTKFGYCNETRKAWLAKILARLAGGTLPGGVAYLGDESVLCETGRTKRGELILILDSLDLDVIENPECFFAEAPSAVERLTDDGRWERVELLPASAGALRLKTVLTPHRPAIFRIGK